MPITEILIAEFNEQHGPALLHSIPPLTTNSDTLDLIRSVLSVDFCRSCSPYAMAEDVSVYRPGAHEALLVPSNICQMEAYGWFRFGLLVSPISRPADSPVAHALSYASPTLQSTRKSQRNYRKFQRFGRFMR